MGDLNAKVGEDNAGMQCVMGQQGKGIRNNNGERLVDFCMHNSLVIGGTIFQHKEIHTLTWTSPNGRVKNQIDHIMINKKWRTSLQDVKVRRGPDVNSDNYLVIGKVRLKLRRTRAKTDRKVFDIRKLKNEDVKRRFCLELNNRFEALGNLGESIEDQWGNIRNVYTDTSQIVLGFRNNKRKEWITDGTWRLVQERKEVKHQIHACRDEAGHEQRRKEYTRIDKKVKASAKADKRRYIEEQAEKAETAAYRGDLKTLYNITKQLCGKMSTYLSNFPNLITDQIFDVTIRENEDSRRLDLSGDYKLHVSITSLALEDKKTKQILYSWHYEHIRQYGMDKSSNIFRIKSGSRCATGVGHFVFEVAGNPKNLTTAIDFQTSYKAASAQSLASKLGLENQQIKEKDSANSPKSGKRSSGYKSEHKSLSVSIDKNSNEHCSESIQTPSQISEDFRHELEEQVAHTPKSPEKEVKTRTNSKEKKTFQNFFKKKDKSERRDSKGKSNSRKSVKKEHLYDEAEIIAPPVQRADEPLYDEAETNVPKVLSKPAGGNSQFYDEALPERKDAWKNLGRTVNVHEENYKLIQEAAKDNEGKSIQPPPVDYDDDDDDGMYDRVILNPQNKKPAIVPNQTDDSAHIYGTSSGKLISEIEEDYATADYTKAPNSQQPKCSNEPEDIYDDTALPSSEYTDAVSTQKIRKPVPQLYEEVNVG